MKKLFITALVFFAGSLFFLTPKAEAAISVVKSASSTSATAALANVTTGNLIVMYVNWEASTATGTTISDGSNQFIMGTLANAGGNEYGQFGYLIAPATGNATYTATLPSGGQFADSIVYEVACTGGCVLDQQSVGTGTGTTPDSGSVTTANAPQIAFGGTGNFNANVASNEKIAGQAADGVTRLTASDNPSMWYKIFSGSFTGSASATIASQQWVANIITFREPGAAEQEGYRFRNDDGSESAATWLSAQDATTTQAAGTNTRLRILINASGTVPTSTYQLEYMKNGAGSWLVASSTLTISTPTVVATSSAAGTAAVTPTIAAVQPDDIVFLFASSNGEPSTTLPTADWHLIDSFKSGAGISTSTAIDAYWIRATSTSIANPTITDRGNVTFVGTVTVRGALATGTPFAVYATTTDSVANSTTLYMAGPTTTSNNNLILALIADTFDNASQRYSSFTNGNLASPSITEALDGGTASNNGVGGGIAYGGKAAAGAVGTTTVVTAATAAQRNYSSIVLGIIPTALPDIIVSASPNIAAGGATPTTAQLTSPAGKTTSNFTAGFIGDDTNPFGSLTMATNTYTELEWSLIATSTAASNDTYTFRVTNSGSALTTYSVTPAWVIGTAAPAAPDATSASTTAGGDGARSGDSITISGTNFGTVSAGSRATCNGAAGTGCVKFVVGGTDTVADGSVSAWTNTSITFTVSSTLATEGGTSTLQVWAANASDTTPLTFYIYPRISSISSIGTNAARVYNAADTDGLIELIGDHFGTTTSTASIINQTATLHYSTGGACTAAGYSSSTQCYEVPASIATSTYSGILTLTRASDGKQATTSLSIWPRILSVTPTSTYIGQTVQILGDHLCYDNTASGTCPVAPDRATSTYNVKFGAATSSDSDFLALTGGAGACNGSGAAWLHGEICVMVPTTGSVGAASTTVTTLSVASNIFGFTITDPPTPGTPGTPTYTNVNSSTLTVNWATSTNSTYYKLERATSSQVFAQITTTTAASYGDSGLGPNTTYYYRVRGWNSGGDGPYSASSSALTLPGAPGTPTFTNVAATTLTVNWSVPTNGAAYYRVERAPDSAGSPGTFAEIATTTNAGTYGDSGLVADTIYWYKVRATNATGNGAYGGNASTTTTSANSAPAAPTQDLPLNGVQDVSINPVFRMTATDANSDALQYKVTIYSNAGCTTVVQTNDQSASQTGWSGQNASSSQEYTSGTQGVFTVQSALAGNSTYYWKASAKDPEGSGTWTDSATCNSFITTYGNWTTDSGSWSLSGNQLTVTPASGASVQLHASNYSVSNDVIEFRAKASAVGANTGNIAGIMRADTGANRYHVTMGDFLNQLELTGKTISSAYSSLASTSFTFSGGTFAQFRGSLSGTTLRSWVNGGSALSTTDSALSSAGFIGLAASSTNGSATFTFDDFAAYTGTTISMANIPASGCWGIRNAAGTLVASSTASPIDLATYSGQVPVDYANGGGSLAVWTNTECTGSPDQTYPSTGLATDIFGGDSYSYSAAESSTPGGLGGTVAMTSTITISAVGAISY